MDAASLVSEIAPPLDRQLAEALLSEFVAVERRYVLGDWEPATLDGGQVAEVGSRIVYHIDSGNLSRRKGVNECLKYVEDVANRKTHRFTSRRTALHLCKVLRVLYKFRSQRGAIHIDPDYDANELDATLVIAMARWLVAEILRVFWTGNESDVARVIREIVRYEVPSVMVMDGRLLVLRTDCTVEEEILLVLHNAGEEGVSRREIGDAVPRSAGAVTNALRRLTSANRRQAVRRGRDTYVLTPNGTRRIHQELSEKLSL